MDGVRHDGPLIEGHIYQCSSCGGLVKVLAIPYLNRELRENQEMIVRHIGDHRPLCPDAYIERLWPC